MSGPKKRLAAILAADVADYSRHAAEDEARMLEALRVLRHDILVPLVAEHRGAVAKSMGDGWLVEFASAVDAVNCGVAMQTRIADHAWIQLRMGIHVGDIVHEDDDLYGDGVNIAARLQQIAPPGGIMLSDTARRSIDGTLGARFVALGARRLKHIPSAMVVHGWRGMAAEDADGDTAARKAWKDAEHLVVALARTGDREAFTELVRRRQSWIRNLMRRACGDPALADDLAQDVFLRAWDRIGQLKHPERFDGWLRRLAIHVWLAHARRFDALRDAEDVETNPAAQAGRAGDPGLAVETGMDLDAALSTLPAAMRIVIVLAYHEGMSHGEIVEQTGLPLGTVKSHVRRGTQRLRACLSDAHPPHAAAPGDGGPPAAGEAS